jgi:hypothetical protein
MADNEEQLKKASELIKAFSKEKEPEHLREAALSLEEIDLKRIYKKSDRERVRSQALVYWLLIIETIDSNLDPNFDVNEELPLKVSAPPLKDGTVLPPGASPDKIADPKEREEYEKAVKENREKQEKHAIQSQLYEINGPVSKRAEEFIQKNYARTEEDKNAVRNAVERQIKNEQRKARFLALLESPY